MEDTVTELVCQGVGKFKKEKRLGTAALKGKHSCEWQRVQVASERCANGSFMFVHISSMLLFENATNFPFSVSITLTL